MLTIQPNFLNSYSNNTTFGNRNNIRHGGEYVDFEEFENKPREKYVANNSSSREDYFDLEYEKQETKKELDLWQETKQNVENIARTTESIPGVKTGTKIMSALISIAIGWGGLRWGTVGTLEVLSKVSKSRLAQATKAYGEAAYEKLSGLVKSGKKFIKGKKFYQSSLVKLESWKQAFKETRIGKILSNTKETIINNPIYQRVVSTKNDTVAWVKRLNPKRIFVEAMGVAGGGTAAINTLGGKPVDGVKYNVEQDEDGFTIDGCRAIGDYSDAA